MVRSWQPEVPVPPVIRKPRFMLGGRLAVMHEPSFMLATRGDKGRSASAPEQDTASKSAPVGSRGGVSVFSPPLEKPSAPARDKLNGT
jgi:hypothetical protein